MVRRAKLWRNHSQPESVHRNANIYKENKVTAAFLKSLYSCL